MNKHYPKLFERGRIGRLEIVNRIVKAATGTYLANPDMSVSDRMLSFYADMARGGAGLVFADNAIIMDEYHMGIAGFADKFIPGMALLASAIKDNGACAGLQLSHPGRDGAYVGGAGARAASRMQWEDWYEHGMPIPQELTIEEIHDLVEKYGDAARRARIAGFDIVEIHAAAGTLPSNFLSPADNKRNDMYGGSLKGRMRFLVEASKNIKKKAGADFPLSIRLSLNDFEPGGIVLAESIETAKALEEAGVDVINAFAGSHAEAAHAACCMLLPRGITIPMAAAVKEAVGIPVIVVGSITTPDLAEEIIKSKAADFIALGRPLLADPYWPVKAKEGRAEDIVPCIRCNEGCHDRGMLSNKPTVCTVNPTIVKQDGLRIEKAEKAKSVAVIGGGPAGMEAARVLTLRGHKVTMYEKRELGGSMIEAAVPDFKADIKRLIEYYKVQLKKLNIKVVKEEATIEKIKDGKFDAVILAAGAVLKKPDVIGIDNPIVTDALEVLRGNAKVGKKVVVIGGGVTAAETGLYLAEQGKEITFVEMLDVFMPDVGINRNAYNERLFAQKVTVHTGMLLYEVKDKAVVIMDRYGNKQEIKADSVVLAAGFAPRHDLRQLFEDETDLEVYAIGDCMGARLIFDAIHEGFLTARRI